MIWLVELPSPRCPSPAGLLALHVAATTGPCTQQLLDTGTSSNLAANIDPDSPATACSMAVCTSTELGGCASAAKENLILVMSDEFNKDGRGLAVYQNDPLWTAENVGELGLRDQGRKGLSHGIWILCC